MVVKLTGLGISLHNSGARILFTQVSDLCIQRYWVPRHNIIVGIEDPLAVSIEVLGRLCSLNSKSEERTHSRSNARGFNVPRGKLYRIGEALRLGRILAGFLSELRQKFLARPNIMQALHNHHATITLA